MRIMGGLAAFIICMLMGWGKASVFKMREDIMLAFSADIQALAVEMEYRPRNIKDMVCTFAQSSLNEFWRMFSDGIDASQSAELAWRHAVKEYTGFDALNNDERLLIAEAGRLMGRQNMQDCISSLKQRSIEAAKRAERINCECAGKGVIYRRLGLLGGLAVMLLIV